MKKSLAKSVFLIFLSVCVGSSPVHAAELCRSIFTEGPYHNDVVELALSKTFKDNGYTRGLSSKDLRLFVEKVYRKKEGSVYKFSEYWKYNAEERTIRALEREIGEIVTHRGLEQYFRDNNFLIASSRLKTKLIEINRSETMNILAAGWMILSLGHGSVPIILPEAMIKTSKEDLNTLLLKGFDSPEAKEILLKNKSSAELKRGYKLFQRYYTRFALAVLLYLVYDKTKESLEKNRQKQSDDAFDLLMSEFDKILASHSEAKTKEDILFETVIANFQEKYNRLPNETEMQLIHQKVYGAQ